MISGLMVDVYYPNGILLLIPLFEAVGSYWRILRRRGPATQSLVGEFLAHITYMGALVVALLPTIITRQLIFGNPLRTGYGPVELWNWKSPALWNVLFSSDHGLFSWTPILLLASIGLLPLRRVDKTTANYLIASMVAFYCVIALHANWDGLSSFGGRFFVSLTPMFVLGLAALFDFAAMKRKERPAAIALSAATAVLILWKPGLIFQWGTHLIPARGPISFGEAAYNQVAVVPAEATRTLKDYFMGRKRLMNHIEQVDVNQLKSSEHTGTK